MTPTGPGDLLGFAIGLLIAAALGAFWIWAVVDSVKRQRYGWTVVMFVLSVPAALAYYRWGRQPRAGELLRP